SSGSAHDRIRPTWPLFFFFFFPSYFLSLLFLSFVLATLFGPWAKGEGDQRGVQDKGAQLGQLASCTPCTTCTHSGACQNGRSRPPFAKPRRICPAFPGGWR